jgi:hypothetical protein
MWAQPPEEIQVRHAIPDRIAGGIILPPVEKVAKP